MNISKSSTTYSSIFGTRSDPRSVCVTVSHEAGNPHISVQEYGEPCSGILRHWGSPEALIAELEQIIKVIKEVETK